MRWSHWIRQTHRWVSVIFAMTVIANFVALSRHGSTRSSSVKCPAYVAP